MSVVTVKSTAISNRDATPTVPTGASIAGGNVREFEGYCGVTNGDSIGSVYIMGSVPSNSRISTLKLQCDALGTSCTANVGVYVPTQTNPALLALSSNYTGGAAISASFFASALDVHAALGVTDVTNQSGSNTIAKQEMELWQAIGLASDPGCNLDIAVALAAAAAATGKVSLKGSYVQ